MGQDCVVPFFQVFINSDSVGDLSFGTAFFLGTLVFFFCYLFCGGKRAVEKNQ